MSKKAPRLIGERINDKKIVQLCKHHYTNMAFIRLETRNKLNSLIQKANGPGKTNLLCFSNDLMDIWELLLTDAIFHLKVNDDREFSSSMDRKWVDEESFGVNDLASYFRHFSDFEKLLYGADRFYREHTAHVFRVWVMGVSIMNHFANNSINIQKDVDDKLKKEEELNITSGEEEAMWCIIALSHDLGYPLGKITGINESIRNIVGYFGKASLEDFAFSFPPQTHFLNDFILRFVASKLVLTNDGSTNHLYKTSLQSKFYLKFSKSFEEYKHGIVSCIILMKNLVFFLESDYDFEEIKKLDAKDARQFQIRKEILRSIATHTCNDIYHINLNTFSFLLFFCDEAQFWGRPIFDDLLQGDIDQCHATIQELSANSIYLVLDFTNQKDKDKMNNKYFVSKAKDLRKLFRTAVKTNERSFSFTFEIVDHKYCYRIKFKPRNKVRIECKKNGGTRYTETTYEKLINLSANK